MKKWKCTVCGYIHEGEEAPDKCPVCGAGKEKFTEITEDTAGSIDLENENKEEPAAKEVSIITRLILKNHLHPISVHSPNGIIPMAVLFLLPVVLFNFQSFANAAYYSLFFVLLAMPPVLISGYVTWQNKYKGERTTLFTMKIGASLVATITLFILVAWKTVQPDILSSSSSGRWSFLLLSFLLLASVGLAGHLGGKLVFGSNK